MGCRDRSETLDRYSTGRQPITADSAQTDLRSWTWVALRRLHGTWLVNGYEEGEKLCLVHLDARDREAFFQVPRDVILGGQPATKAETSSSKSHVGGRKRKVDRLDGGRSRRTQLNPHPLSPGRLLDDEAARFVVRNMTNHALALA